VFMKFFMDDLSVFGDLKMHLAKLWLCFDKCQEFGMILNSKKWMFFYLLKGHTRVCCLQGEKIT
jgi:hypothetical protein